MREPSLAARWLADAAAPVAVEPREAAAMATLLALTPQFIWEADAAGAMVYCSAHGRDALGIGLEELRGDGWLRTVEPSWREPVRADWRRAVEAGRRFESEYPILRARDGTWRWHLVRAEPVRDRAGRLERWVGIALDVHDARTLREQRAEADRNSVQLAAALEATNLTTWALRVAERVFVVSAETASLHALDEQRVPWDVAFDTIHPEDAARVRAAVEACAGGGPTYDQTYRTRDRDGGWRWVRSVGRFVPADTAPGGVAQVLGVNFDLTEQREAQERLAASEQRLRLAVEAVDLGLFDYDPQTRASWWSARMRALFGFGPDEPLSRDALAARIHPDDRTRHRAAFERALSPEGGAHYACEYRVLVDGAVRWLAINARVVFAPAPRPGGAPVPVRVTGVAVDRTAERTLIEALREADRRKDEFLATLAHELRNPLAPIVNAVRLLDREPGLSMAAQRGLEMIRRQAHQMRHLVDDLLEVSRITRGAILLKPEPIVLGTLVLAAVEAALPAAEAKGLRLEASLPRSPVRIVADPVRVAQVLENLLGNAVKYTPEGGRVQVELAAPRDGAVEVAVEDDGIGIPPDKLERVFELFVQAEPGVGEHQGGLGIGLALVKRLVELHGGSVRADSAGRGRGARFVVRWPLGGPAS